MRTVSGPRDSSGHTPCLRLVKGVLPWHAREAGRRAYTSQVDSFTRYLVQVAKWGNSLAVRLPRAAVEALGLHEGDKIELRVEGARELEVSHDRSREKALERLRRLRRPLPDGFTFDRDQAQER